MRNGNSLHKLRLLPRLWFNRIYEEWKPSTNIANLVNLVKFNRIYEEWKPLLLPSGSSYPRSFNRIYEEWKQLLQLFDVVCKQGSIESMRNGNRVSGPFFYRVRFGSIESMRNGNNDPIFVWRYEDTVQSNLWGMETRWGRWGRRGCKLVQSNLWGMETTEIGIRDAGAGLFNRIYEEWKRRRSRSCCTTSCLVQSNLWGMETLQDRWSCAPRDKFNRIYEEWKHEVVLTEAAFVKEFNRIYEEWKPAVFAFSSPTPLRSIESMRNGNLPMMEGTCEGGRCSIESMRNGNFG